MLTKTDAGRRMVHKVVKPHIFDMKLRVWCVVFFQLIGVKSTKKNVLHGSVVQITSGCGGFFKLKCYILAPYTASATRKIPTLREHFFDRMTKFAWRVSRWQPTGAWRVLCLWSVGYDEFRKRPKNWATAAPWVKSDQKWHFCWNLHELKDVRSSFFWIRHRKPYLT